MFDTIKCIVLKSALTFLSRIACGCQVWRARLGWNDRLIVKKLTFKRNGAVFGPHNLIVLSDNLICPTYSQSLIDVRSVHMSVFLCPTQRKHCE